MEHLFNILKSITEPVTVIAALIMLLMLNSWIFRRMRSVQYTGNIIRRSIAFLLILLAVLAFILSLPVDRELKGQILSFLAIIISAGIALSSTTVLGNLIAGLMNNSMNRFRNGDLIRINDLQGRVLKKSIFHIEIQLEDSNFVTIPNLFIATNPVKLTRKTNTVISTSISLGYDVPRTKIEEILKEAALATGLKDPYVYITELGDYSVVYKIHGFLDDSSKFFSTSSLLNAKVMDALHGKQVEIVSPSFMNQRRVDEQKFIPKYHSETKDSKKEVPPEDLIFDEAIKSGELEKKKDFLATMIKKKEDLEEKLHGLSDEDEKKKLKSSIKHSMDLIKRIEENIRKKIDEKD